LFDGPCEPLTAQAQIAAAVKLAKIAVRIIRMARSSNSMAIRLGLQFRFIFADVDSPDRRSTYSRAVEFCYQVNNTRRNHDNKQYKHHPASSSGPGSAGESLPGVS
jgi:hypothetical protein